MLKTVKDEPQGTVLRPKLFKLNENDLSTAINIDVTTTQYADDYVFFAPSEDKRVANNSQESNIHQSANHFKEY